MIIEFPESLPVSGKRDEITAAIAAHQVVIVCGETGSGKTTQLPKIALAMGRGKLNYPGGRGPLIGHTQPRRIAASSVAKRIAADRAELTALSIDLRQNPGSARAFTAIAPSTS